MHAVNELKAGAVEGALAATDTAAREASRMRDMTRDWWHHQADLARGAAGSIKREAVAIGESTQRYVHEQPGKSMLWAALASALITGLALMSLGRRH
jgi:ElaB/YqjD/DUF883 family membrane-anchored ribosome-binding protein